MNPILIKNIDQPPLSFYVDEKLNSYILHEGKKYTSVTELMNACPVIAAIPSIFAQAINFLIHELRYEVIEAPEEFIMNYQSSIEAEKQSNSLDTPRTNSFGRYNVREIDLPKLQNGQLIFYAVDLSTGVPYRVTFVVSHAKGKIPLCKYELLPI